MNNLEKLQLTQFKANLDDYISYLENEDKTFVDVLYELTEKEMKLRVERAMNACVKVANFPFLKTFDDFDFNFQPSINRDQLINFRYLKFIENKENIIFIGSPVLEKHI